MCIQVEHVGLQAASRGASRSQVTRNRRVGGGARKAWISRAWPPEGRLAEGSYIVLQVPETMVSVWDWRDWGCRQAPSLAANSSSRRGRTERSAASDSGVMRTCARM